VGLPVHAVAARGFGLLVDGFNQRLADTTAAHRFGGEQILQVADGNDARRAAVIQVMREAHQFAAGFGDQRVHRFIRIKKTRPGHGGDLIRQRRGAGAAIKAVVAGPEGRQALKSDVVTGRMVMEEASLS
jgi:ribosomal protein L14